MEINRINTVQCLVSATCHLRVGSERAGKSATRGIRGRNLVSHRVAEVFIDKQNFDIILQKLEITLSEGIFKMVENITLLRQKSKKIDSKKKIVRCHFHFRWLNHKTIEIEMSQPISPLLFVQPGIGTPNPEKGEKLT